MNQNLQKSSRTDTRMSYQESYENNELTEAIATPSELAGKYRFVRELGHGTQGHVYEAQRVSDGHLVAIKQLRIDSVQTWKEYDLFMREAHALQSLNYKGIATFYEALEFLDIEHPAAYIVQEYIDGRSLGEMMKNGYRFSMQRIFEIVVRMLTLLKQLHQNVPPVIHRDIKPSNILFRPQENGDDFDLFLIDFGAVANPQIQTGGSTVAGTFGYMPPEQLMGKPVPGSDIYALAAMVAYMLSGVEPGEMQVTDFRLIIDPHLENVPQAVVAVLRQMLTPDLSHRLCDYDLLIDKFTQFAANVFPGEGVSKSHLTPEELNAMLRNVEQYGQSGNIDIWDDLPDAVPRKIPTVYQSLSETALPETSSFNETVGELMRPVVTGAFKFNLMFAVLWNGIIGFISVCMFATSNISWEILFLLPFMAAGAYLIYATVQAAPRRHLAIYNERSDTYKRAVGMYRMMATDCEDNYRKLFTMGRKSVATIVDVEYKSAEDILIEPFMFTQAKSCGSSNNQTVYTQEETDKKGYYCHRTASYTIRYKFNPPDDSSPYDLVHEVVTCSDCEGKLNPGDLIPILYYINPDDNREVISTPYPVPFCDFGNYGHLIGYSLDMAAQKVDLKAWDAVNRPA
ncbi:MAG: serine/threonine protein kinase [Proteobacteria bacterium]|nr:serine/threonine protein kinase [Pseudomonadota bacterium]